MRAHFYRLVVDSQGNLLSDITVRVLEPGTTDPLAVPIYADGDTLTAMANPFTASNGVINFYLDQPRRVRLGITQGSVPEQFYENIDVLTLGDVPTQIQIKSPSGTVYGITVDDNGVLSTAAI